MHIPYRGDLDLQDHRRHLFAHDLEMVAEEPPPTAPTFEELEASLDECTLSMLERVVEDGMSEEDGTLERHHHFELRERESPSLSHSLPGESGTE